jgi:DNA-binding CsgD family transcriptional regulator
MEMSNSALHHEVSTLKFPLTGRRNHSFKCYEGELTENRSADLQLHNALALADAQLRQNEKLIGQLKDKLTQQQQVLSKLSALQQDASKRLAGLTWRQLQIVELVLAGCPNKNIASNLGISQRTVENHRASIMRKTGSKSLPALVRVGFAASWNGDDHALILHQAHLSPNLHTLG